ncbi:MAG: hypothetical protein SFV81_22520 [Pirellulaceae bacterium]|nr:hypothetical protein [Pirellulaceae bacterium]
MLRRIQPLVNLLHQRQFYVLLVLFAPLTFSLHWMPIRFPIRGPGYIQSSIHEIEPDKLAVVFEYFGPMGPGACSRGLSELYPEWHGVFCLNGTRLRTHTCHRSWIDTACIASSDARRRGVM